MARIGFWLVTLAATGCGGPATGPSAQPPATPPTTLTATPVTAVVPPPAAAPAPGGPPAAAVEVEVEFAEVLALKAKLAPELRALDEAEHSLSKSIADQGKPTPLMESLVAGLKQQQRDRRVQLLKLHGSIDRLKNQCQRAEEDALARARALGKLDPSLAWVVVDVQEVLRSRDQTVTELATLCKPLDYLGYAIEGKFDDRTPLTRSETDQFAGLLDFCLTLGRPADRVAFASQVQIALRQHPVPRTMFLRSRYPVAKSYAEGYRAALCEQAQVQGIDPAGVPLGVLRGRLLAASRAAGLPPGPGLDACDEAATRSVVRGLRSALDRGDVAIDDLVVVMNANARPQPLPVCVYERFARTVAMFRLADGGERQRELLALARCAAGLVDPSAKQLHEAEKFIGPPQPPLSPPPGRKRTGDLGGFDG